ncbi:MAG: Peptidase, (Thimet oligopeptidase) family [Myxococcales bacterium]|nr:Peptidase, (Thimet oligopeptidase) family [Myxococcales bacterium]
MMRHSIYVLGFLAACAAPQNPPPAAPPSAPAAAATPARTPAQFQGELAAAGGPALSASCTARLQSARDRITRFKALSRPVPRAGVDRALEIYDEASADIDTAAAIADLVFNAHPDAAVRAVGEKCSQQASALATEITLDRGVYDVLSGLDLEGQDAATRYWIAQDLADFKRAGVNRDDATRAKVKTLRDEIVVIGQTFDQNVNNDASKVSLPAAALAGLPPDYVAKHPAGADGKITLTTQYPDYFPFMTFAKSSSAREQLYRAFKRRAYPKNMEVLSQLLAKRHELATLLGYPSWAAYSMENKMIRTPEAAHKFVDQITAVSGRRAAADHLVLLKRLQKERPSAKAVPAWDAAYLKERVRAEQLDFDAQSVRPYFEFTRVKGGLLSITSQLFGIEYKRVDGIKLWHPDVEAYDVVDAASKERLGRIYLDLHPRAGKYSHAAQFSFVTGKQGARLPEGVLVCNFPKADGTTPALMEHGDVRTFFHEFGHLVHHVFAGHTRWTSTAGLRESDFVEAPSQLLEEWVDDAATLQTFALHYQTNEPIPAALVARMRTAEEFGRGLDVRRQMVFAATSLAYYDKDPKGLDTTRVLSGIETRYTPFAHVDGTFEQAAFGHLVGYSSNYYTYMWSLVIAKDLFTPFKAAGMLDTATASRYRKAILEAGGSRPAASSVEAFLGRPFQFDAYQKWLDEGAAAQ